MATGVGFGAPMPIPCPPGYTCDAGALSLMAPSILFKPTKWNVATLPTDISNNFALLFGYVMELDLEGQTCRAGTVLNTDLSNDK